MMLNIIIVDFMIAMVAVMVASCPTIPTAPGVVAGTTKDTPRFTSTCTTATGLTAPDTSYTVLCLLGLLISPNFLKWCKIS